MTDRDTDHASHHHGFSDAFAEHLDREALLATGVTSRALDRAATALDRPVRTVLDLGSGTGSGTVALARRFPNAQVHSLDLSTELLDRLASAAARAGVSGQVHPHPVDLDDDWTKLVPAGVDLAWASLSLHHVIDPALVLQRALSVLRPGGVLVVTEMSGSIALEPDDLGTGRHGLADRVTDGLAALGHPSTAEWTVPLAEAGYVRTQRELTDLTVASDNADGAAYLATQLSAWHNNLAQTLSSDDLIALKTAEREIRTGSSPVTQTSGRVVWIAFRPDAESRK